MKQLFIFIALAFSANAFSQQVITGDKKWNGVQTYMQVNRYDTSTFDLSSGLVLSIDSAGSDTTGYYTIEAGTVSGFVTGSGAATRVPIWSGASALTSDANFIYDALTDRLSVTTATGSVNIGGTFLQSAVGPTLVIETPENDSVMSFSTDAITTKEILFAEDSIMLDTTLFSPSLHGRALTLDSVGSAANGFMRIGSTPVTSGTVTGTGVASQVSFWTGASAQGGSANLTWNNTTSALGVTSGVSTTPVRISGADGDTLGLLSGKYFQTSSAVNLMSPAGDGINLYVDGNLTGPKIAITTTGTVVNSNTLASTDFSVASLTGTAMHVDVGNNFVGINTNTPGAFLDIDANLGVFMHLTDPDTEAAEAQVGTLTNLPAGTSGGNPDVFLIIQIGLIQYVFPGWALP